MSHWGDDVQVSWLRVFAPLIWPTVFVGVGYLMGWIVDWWRKR